MTSKKKKKSQKNYLSLGILTLAILGIFASVYLVQKHLDIRQHAGFNENAFESIYNPFGDPWSSKKAPNHDIPVSLSTGCYREGEKGTTDDLSPEEMQYLANTNAPVIYIDCAVVQSEDYQLPHLNKLKNMIQQIKIINPSVKVIGYLVLQEGQPVGARIVTNANQGDATFESFLVHKKDLPQTKENRLSGRPDHPEWGYAPVFDITNSNYRNYAIPKIAAAVKDMGLDGVMIDSIAWDTPSGLGIRSSMPDSIANNWLVAQAAFIQELKTAVKDKLLFANVRLDELDYIKNDLLRPERLDGIMLEDPIGPEANAFVPGNSRYDKLTAMLQLAKERDKYVFVVVNTNINCTDSGPNCFTTTNKTSQIRYASYFLAAFLHVFTSEKQMLIFYTPIQNHSQFFSETFFREWDLPIGSSTSSSEQIGNGIYVRKFQNGYVFLNTTYNDFTLPVTLGSGLYAPDGTDLLNAVIPAKSGKIFVTRTLLDTWNPGWVPLSPAPSNVPTVTGSAGVDKPVSTQFHLQPISVYCVETGKPRVHLEWTASGDYEYKVFMRDQFNNGVETEIGRTTGTAFNVETSQGMIPGHSYGFLIGYITPQGGSVFSDNAWSDSIYGWKEIPTCEK